MKARINHVDDHGHRYDALVFVCPGCEHVDGDGVRHGGLHMLPISGDADGRPMWTFDGNLDAPTLSPSILSRRGPGADDLPPAFVCHSFLEAGRFRFLGDCTHELAGQTVDLPDLYEWAVGD